ncbi:MAG TPA: hypothetical protein VNQ14_14845, partial [Woeseiaceae bacterium]|nr:hypothetical protein [Woeseiaceae bacterium]
DPRCDMDDDGDVDSADQTLYNAKDFLWPLPSSDQPTVAQAFSDVGNPYMFQGVPHFAIDTAASATSGKYMLNHHRARFADPVIGRWVTRDPLFYLTEANSPLPPYRLAPIFHSATKRIGTTRGATEYIRDIQSMLLFSFERQNPLTSLDPSGMESWCQSAAYFEHYGFGCMPVDADVVSLLNNVAPLLDQLGCCGNGSQKCPCPCLPFSCEFNLWIQTNWGSGPSPICPPGAIDMTAIATCRYGCGSLPSPPTQWPEG